MCAPRANFKKIIPHEFGRRAHLNEKKRERWAGSVVRVVCVPTGKRAKKTLGTCNLITPARRPFYLDGTRVWVEPIGTRGAANAGTILV